MMEDVSKIVEPTAEGMCVLTYTLHRIIVCKHSYFLFLDKADLSLYYGFKVCVELIFEQLGILDHGKHDPILDRGTWGANTAEIAGFNVQMKLRQGMHVVVPVRFSKDKSKGGIRVISTIHSKSN